ncbi:MAG: phage terminase small subunit P27 family [Acidobacteria bacterium]|nr:phage terminase small subunit P27 family [Acidobacteriota bacterium]
MRGRKPTPLEVQIARGDPRNVGKRVLEERAAAQVKATPGLPPCPRHLRGRARSAWHFWAAELEVMEMDRRPDSMALEGACVSYGRAVAADLLLARVGLVIEEPVMNADQEQVGTKVKTHPAVAVSNRAWYLVKAFCSEFGFTPISRMRLPSGPKKEASADLLALLSLPRERRPLPQETAQ